MDPINFNVDVQTPFQSALQGYQAGMGIRDDQLKQQQLVLAQQQQQRQAQMLQSLISNPNAGAKEYAAATLVMPQLKDNFKQAWEMKSADQQQSGLKDISQYYAAVQNGRPDIAAQLMSQRADAMQASGVPKNEVDALRTQAQVVQAHPEFARSMMGMLLASVPGGDKVISSAAMLGSEARAAEQGPADLAIKQASAGIKTAEAAVAPQKNAVDIANVQSQIGERSARLGLDRDKLQTDTQIKLAEMQQKFGELPEFVVKDIGAATTDAISAQQSAAKMNDLASQIDRAGLNSGASAKAGELWKQTFGTQNELTRIRAEYNRIVTPAAMAAYKQVASGSTSDKDIDTAMIGVPKDTDSPERLASFLRGAAKLQTYESVLNNAKAEWLGANKNLGKTKADIEIDGVKVPAGATFKQFADSYVQRKVGQIAGTTVLNGLAAKYGGAQAAPAGANAGGAQGSY